MKKIRNICLILALVGVASLLSFKAGEKNGTVVRGEPLDLTMMWRVKNRLSQLYLDKGKIDDKQMVYGAISGLVQSLGDPYTVYLPPRENKNANADLAGEFGGVGISLGYKDKTLAVMSPLPKTPAQRAGVLAGDLILRIIDKGKGIDQETTGIALDEAVDLIRGKIGTEVTLKFFREGKKEAWDVTLIRENIVVPSIELEFRQSNGKNVAWIKLYKFTDRLYTEWDQIVAQVLAEKQKGNFGGIVLDVRNNPGGFLQASVMVASDFLKEGIVVSQETADGKKEDYPVDKKLGRLTDDKLVVLVNGGSASASEILAGALKEYQRAKLVGEKTFGKGTVQQPEDFTDGSGLHITIARWLLPNGKNIHKEGVMPNVEVKYIPIEITGTPTPTPKDGPKVLVKDNQLDKAIEVLLQ